MQCNPKALNYENSEDLFKVMERFSELINDFKDLKVDKLPPIKNYEDNNKFNISEVKSEKDNHALFFNFFILITIYIYFA